MKSLLFLVLLAAGACAAEQAATHRITGLFSPDREADLHAAVEKLPGVRIASIDFEHAEAVFVYDAAVAFAGVKPERLIETFDQQLRAASNHTLGIQPLIATPREQLTRVEIPVRGLDCKACGLGTYQAIYKLPGVAQASVSFREGLVSVLLDPQSTSRAELEEALKKRGVTLGER